MCFENQTVNRSSNQGLANTNKNTAREGMIDYVGIALIFEYSSFVVRKLREESADDISKFYSERKTDRLRDVRTF